MSGSQSERRITVPAGSSLPVRVPGDFIFIKYADRPVIVRVNEQAITMRAGDSRRIERAADNPMAPAFDIFELQNDDEVAPLAVEFVAGMGDFDSKIIHGEIMSVPGVRRGDGIMIPDRRYWREAWLNWDDTTVRPFQEGDSIRVVTGVPTMPSGGWSPSGGWVRDGVVYLFSTNPSGGGNGYIRMFDASSGDYIGEQTLWGVLGLTEVPWSHVIFVSYDAIEDRLIVTATRSSGSDIRSVWYYRFGGFSTVSGRDDRFTWSTASGDRIVSVSRDPLTGCYVSLRVMGAPKRVEIFDRAGAFLFRYDDPAGVGLGVNSKSFWYRSRTRNRLALYDHSVNGDEWLEANQFLGGNYQVIEGPPVSSYGYAGWGVPDPERRAIHVLQGGSYRKIAAEDFTAAGRFYITANRARVVRSNPLDIFGDYQFSGVGDSRGVEGPIIKAVLWGMLGREPDDDYLDHVYAAEFSPALNGAPAVIKNSGFDSFVRAGFADAFKVPLPVRVRLLIDL